MYRTVILILVAIILGISFHGQARAAGRCTDVQESYDKDNDQNRFIFTNTCSYALELKIMDKEGGRVCDVYRVEPHVTRVFVQEASCSGMNELLNSCRCLRRLHLQERKMTQ